MSPPKRSPTGSLRISSLVPKSRKLTDDRGYHRQAAGAATEAVINNDSPVDTAGNMAPDSMDWVSNFRQPRSRRPDIVGMLRTRNL